MKPYFAVAASFLGVCGCSVLNLLLVLPFANDVREGVEPFEFVWACECECEWLCP